MAKELEIKIIVDGKEIVASTENIKKFKTEADNLRKSLEELGDRTEENAEQFDKLKTDAEQAEKVFNATKEEFNKLNKAFDDSTKKSKTLSQEIRQVLNQIQALGPKTAENADEFDRLNNRLQELRDVQEDVGFQTQKLDDALAGIPGPIGQAASAFKVFDETTKNIKSAIGTLGNSFKDVRDNIKNFKVSDLGSSIKGLIPSFAGLRAGLLAVGKAIIASGVGAFVVVLGLLAAALVKGLSNFKPLQDAVDKLGIAFELFGQIVEPIVEFIGEKLAFALEKLAEGFAFLSGKTEEYNKQLANKKALDEYSKGIKELEDNLKLFGDLNSELQNQQIELAIAYEKELKALAEAQLKDEEERLRLKKGLTERYLRDVNSLNKKADTEERERIKKITEERIKIEREFQKQLKSIQNENRILQSKTEVEAALLRLQFERDTERQSILESQNSQEQKNQLLLELEKKYQLQREAVIRGAEDKLTEFRRSILRLGLDLTSDVVNQETKIRELEYQLQVEQLKKNFEEVKNIYELAGEDLTDIKKLEADTLTLLEQRKNRDLIRLNENYILNRLDQERRIFEGIMNTSEATRIMIETDAADIANAYMKATTFGDIFLGGFEKRMSEEMSMRFNQLQDIRLIYQAQEESFQNLLDLEKMALDAQLNDKLISQIEYESQLQEIERQSIESRANYIQRMIQFDQLRLDAFREVKNEELRIAESANALLQALLGDSIKAQIASALSDAALSIARIIIDTQRAIVAFTASVAPLGPAGLKMAAAYAVRAKINAGLSIAAITVGGINKIKSIQGQGTESESGGRQSNNLGRGYADGGLVTGPGTSRSDSIPARLSNGEFVVNGTSTALFLPLLEMMNNAGRQTSVPSLMTTLNDKPEQTKENTPIIVKSYVVESDMTSSQHKNARLKNLSTL